MWPRLKRIGWAASIAGVASLMIGVMLSVASFADARAKDAASREHEATVRAAEDATRRAALLQPSLDLRRERYLDILKTLGRIAADDQDPKILVEAKRRFWELFWTDLSLVEDDEIKAAMQNLGGMLKGDMPTPEFQQATYKFAGLIRKRIVTLDERAKP
jgi:hypothetical protein